MEHRIPALAPLTPALSKALGSTPDIPATLSAGGFGQALRSALQTVSSAQNDSSEMQRQVQLDNSAVSLEETMVALQKAQIGFAATLHVRNRLVQAYTDVMNMQV